MKLTTILLAVILSVNMMQLQAEEAKSDSVRAPLTYEELTAKLETTKKDKDKIDIYTQMLVIKDKENKALADTLKTTREAFEDYKGTTSFRYLSDKVDIFTEDLPEVKDIHRALHPFARAIANVKKFNAQIEEMNEALDNAGQEVINKGNITLKEFLKSDIGVQDEHQKLKACAQIINSMDLSMFSPEQEKYIYDLYAKYETINKKFE